VGTGRSTTLDVPGGRGHECRKAIARPQPQFHPGRARYIKLGDGGVGKRANNRLFARSKTLMDSSLEEMMFLRGGGHGETDHAARGRVARDGNGPR
jgi:hypothetical protein